MESSTCTSALPEVVFTRNREIGCVAASVSLAKSRTISPAVAGGIELVVKCRVENRLGDRGVSSKVGDIGKISAGDCPRPAKKSLRPDTCVNEALVQIAMRLECTRQMVEVPK